MSRSVVCVSRTLGAGGEQVARLASEQLGYRYVDDEIVRRAAELAGVSAEQVAKAEHSGPLVTRIMDALASAPSASEFGYVVPAVSEPTVVYPHLIEHVILETAETMSVVIVAHGASHALADRPEVLRALVTASPPTRAARIARESDLDAKAAAKAVEESDRERARYLERFYQVKHELPVHYDLTINTDLVDAATAAALVVAAAKV